MTALCLPGLKRLEWQPFAILASAAAVITAVYFDRVHESVFFGQDTLPLRFDMHNQIIQGVADSPYRYRVLAPFLAEGITRLLTWLNLAPAGMGAFKAAYVVHDFGAVCFSLSMLYLLLRQWFSKEQSLAGGLFVAAIMPIALQDHYFQPWSLFEPGFYSLGLLLAYRRQYAWLAVVVLVASLNRETALFIPLLFAATSIDFIPLLKRQAKLPVRVLLLTAGYLLTWLGVFVGLRLLRGEARHSETLAEIWAGNMWSENLDKALVNIPLFMGIGWLFAVLGIKKAPLFIRKSLLIVPFFLITVMAFGIWAEVRTLMPLYPILAALILSYLCDAQVGSDESRAPSAES